ARFWLLVTMMTCSIPAATASSTAYWMTGLSTSGSISLGCALVAGRKRVPQPAAGKTAFRTRIEPRAALLSASAGRRSSTDADGGCVAPQGPGQYTGRSGFSRRAAVAPTLPAPGRPGGRRLGLARLALAGRPGNLRRECWATPRAGRRLPLRPCARQTKAREWDTDVPEDLDRNEEPGQQQHHGDQLAGLEQLGRAKAVQGVCAARDERADRDEDRRRHPAVEPALDERAQGPGQRRQEVDDDRHGCDEEVEQEHVAGLDGVERVGKDAPLGHEHVGREERAQHERDSARDVHE